VRHANKMTRQQRRPVTPLKRFDSAVFVAILSPS